MRKILQFVLVLICGIVISERAVPAVNAQGKPVRVVHYSYDAGAAPANLGELVNKSTVVVDGIVQAEHPSDIVSPQREVEQPPVVTVLTNYDIAVREVFKSVAYMPPNSVMTVQLPGGRRDKGTFIEDSFDARFPTPNIGEEYVLFLRIAKDPGGTWFMPAMGLGESVFLKKGSTVQPRGYGPVARMYRDHQFGELLSTLRQRGGKASVRFLADP